MIEFDASLPESQEMTITGYIRLFILTSMFPLCTDNHTKWFLIHDIFQNVRTDCVYTDM